MKKDSLKLRWARNASESFPLSGVVRLREQLSAGRIKAGVCNVSFDEKEFKRIACEMPRGISPQDPAYIEVEKYNEVYGIFCVYFAKREQAVLLYKTENKPEWLKGVRYHVAEKTKEEGRDAG